MVSHEPGVGGWVGGGAVRVQDEQDDGGVPLEPARVQLQPAGPGHGQVPRPAARSRTTSAPAHALGAWGGRYWKGVEKFNKHKWAEADTELTFAFDHLPPRSPPPSRLRA